MTETDEPPAQVDAKAALRNILQMLQEHPERYKTFGIWWWPVKALLRGAGYGPEQLYMLGRYQDPTTAALVPSLGIQDTLRRALAEHGQNMTFPHADGRVEDEDGDLVTIYDADAGF